MENKVPLVQTTYSRDFKRILKMKINKTNHSKMTKLLDLFGKSPYPPKGEPWRTDIRPPVPEGNAVRIPPLGDRGIFRRSIFFTFFFYCSLLPYGGKTFAQEHDFAERIKHLETTFSKKDYNAFFANFPNAFHELNSIYGYAEDAMPLYYVANEHIDIFRLRSA